MSASKPFAVGATVQHRRQFAYIEPPEGDPVTEYLKQGRKNSDARVSSELNALLRSAPAATKRGRA